MEMKNCFHVCFLISCITGFATAGHAAIRQVIPAQTAAKDVPPERMQQVYDEVKTPHKYGVVIRGEEGQMVDCPSIFRLNDQWYMVYVGTTQKVGYETFIARSSDLLNWDKLGKIMSFQPDGWDKAQVCGGVALCDPTWGGTSQLQEYDGKFWMSYLGGPNSGYETAPLSMGMAFTKTPAEAKEWIRIDENAVLSSDQPDARWFEKRKIFKSQIIWDKSRLLGHPFVMYYNASAAGGERIGMAVSEDMIHWQRYGQEPVIVNGTKKKPGISGDPQIVRMGDLWVMFYFGAFFKPGAFDTFACSYDLVHWTKWEGDDLVKSSEPYDKQSAHKPWVVKHDGTVFHFYTAVGKEGRVIALATSKDLKDKSTR